MFNHSQQIVSHAAQNNVPAVYPWRSVVATQDGLLSYGPDLVDIVRRSAPYVGRPSRNVTGFTMSSPAIAGKRLALLRELVPSLHKVGYLWVPASPMMMQFGKEVRTAAEQLGIELVSLPLKSGPDFSIVFAIAEKEGVEAVLVEADLLTVRYSGTITDECVLRNLPAMHAWPFEVQLGALIAYGPPATEDFRGAADYVDRILQGAKIADLPFQEPTEIRLGINLRTARSIGLNVPATLLARADEVIE